MNSEPGKRRPGRPTGKARPHKVFSYLDDHEVATLQQLESRLRRTRADVLREALLELAKREGMEEE